MISDYSTILTKDESIRDWLLQGVELNRKQYPNFNVQTLNKKICSNDKKKFGGIYKHSDIVQNNENL